MELFAGKRKLKQKVRSNQAELIYEDPSDEKTKRQSNTIGSENLSPGGGSTDSGRTQIITVQPRTICKKESTLLKRVEFDRPVLEKKIVKEYYFFGNVKIAPDDEKKTNLAAE